MFSFIRVVFSLAVGPAFSVDSCACSTGLSGLHGAWPSVRGVTFSRSKLLQDTVQSVIIMHFPHGYWCWY